MPVKKDPSGRRSVELTFEVPGTPEQVWQAIATGPGVSSWFMPTEIEEHEGGRVVFHHGVGEESSGHVTGWQPPHRFACEETVWLEGAPPLATEFIIEARSGGTCTVRLVHSLFASDDDWDDQLESMKTGWPGFFEVLKLYLTHFPGWRSACIRPMGGYPSSQAEAWAALSQALGFSDVAVGDRFQAALDEGPSFAGIVERIDKAPPHNEVMLRLNQPSSGVALIGTFEWNNQVHIAICLFFYGDEAAAVATREEPRWQAWLAKHFPQSEQSAAGG